MTPAEQVDDVLDDYATLTDEIDQARDCGRPVTLVVDPDGTVIGATIS